MTNTVSTSFRGASWNIRKAIGRDMKRNPARVLDGIAALDADVVALQEADLRFGGRAAIFQEDEIARRTGLTPVRFEGGHPGLGWHGNVLLVGPRVTVVASRILHLRGLEPRGAVSADILIDGQAVRIVGAHLALLAPIRHAQATVLARAVEPASAAACIVMGDFNAWTSAPLSLRPLSRRLSQAPTGRSFPASRPVAGLDRIYHGGALRVVECGVRRDGPAGTASDHLPIWAQFELGATG